MRILGVIVAASLVAATLAVVGHGGAPAMRQVEFKGNSSLSAAQAFSKYPLYYPGQQLGDHRLAAVDRQIGPGALPDEAGVDRVSFAYGTCEIQIGVDGDSCTAPLEVQIWPACRRNPSVYPFSPDESFRLRGAEAHFYEGGTRLELTIGRVTAVLFGTNRDLLLEAANALRGVNITLPANATLPGPVRTSC